MKRIGKRTGRSGVAALEMALVSSILITLMIGGLDFGAAMLCKAQITETLSAAAAYATLAGQNPNTVAQSTIQANAKTLAGALTSPFLVKSSANAVINNGYAAGSVCCPGSTWTCSTTPSYTCADKSSAGSYVTITASYKFTPLFSTDTWLTGKTLSGSITAPLQ